MKLIKIIGVSFIVGAVVAVIFAAFAYLFLFAITLPIPIGMGIFIGMIVAVCIFFVLLEEML